jgi:hypothetical protein
MLANAQVKDKVSRDFRREIERKETVSDKSFFSKPGEVKNFAAHEKMKFDSEKCQ